MSVCVCVDTCVLLYIAAYFAMCGLLHIRFLTSHHALLFYLCLFPTGTPCLVVLEYLLYGDLKKVFVAFLAS